MNEPARRFVIAQSWWIASEIARRHPQLVLIETHPCDGMYDCLTLVDRYRWTSVVDLNRVGRLHVRGRTGFATWSDAIGAPDGHEMVRRLERAAELPARRPTPPTTARTLVYRLIARVLTSLIDDRHAWDARNGFHDSSGGDAGRRGDLDLFPTIRSDLDEDRQDGFLGDPACRYWLLTRADEAVAVLDGDGRLHRRDRSPVTLLPLYRRTGSSLTATIGGALGDLLP